VAAAAAADDDDDDVLVVMMLVKPRLHRSTCWKQVAVFIDRVIARKAKQSATSVRLFHARRYASAGISCCRVSVSLSHAGIVSKLTIAISALTAFRFFY